MRSRFRGILTAAPLAFALTVACAAPDSTATRAASAVAAGSYERGPAPTSASVLAAKGPFAYSTVTVPDSASAAFGAATIYYPDDTSQGTFGAVAIVPGYTSNQTHLAWLGPRLASNGFIAMTVNTNSIYAQPGARGTALLAALDWLARSSPAAVRQRLDSTRMGVMGHSMGGGGTLAALRTRPGLKAGVALAPWHSTKTWGAVTPATMLIGGSADTVAPPSRHAEPFYTDLTQAKERAYAEITGATHANGFLFEDHPLIGKFTVSWLKRFLDEDTRYDQFLCPTPADQGLTEYRDSCP